MHTLTSIFEKEKIHFGSNQATMLLLYQKIDFFNERMEYCDSNGNNYEWLLNEELKTMVQKRGLLLLMR